jgi:amidase
MSMRDDLALLDATAQAEMVRRRDCSPREMVDAAIERIERLNPRLNAVIHTLYDKARAAADAPDLPDGPFRGVPILVKDLLCHTAGDPYHAGMRMVRDAGWTSPADSYMAAKLRAAGFLIVGKTNTPEIGSTVTTEPLAYGATHNPWNLAHSVGGSSGGSGAAVAAGMTAVAEANDGGGSIRIPASECGLVGLKPTRGRISLGPMIGDLWHGCAVEGAVTRTVRDTAALLDATQGAMPGDPYTAPPPRRPYVQELGAAPGRLRIGLHTRAPGNIVPVHADCVQAAEHVARQLEALGHVVEPARPAAFDEDGILDQFMVLVSSWIAHDVAEWSEATGRPADEHGVESSNLLMAQLGNSHGAPAYIRALRALHANARRMAAWWEEGWDLLLTPTLAEPPPPLGDFADTAGDPTRSLTRPIAFAAFTSPFNMTGQPAISLPLAWSSTGLPVGIQLAAAAGREDLLVRIAAQLEAAHPWDQHRPPVHACAHG